MRHPRVRVIGVAQNSNARNRVVIPAVATNPNYSM